MFCEKKKQNHFKRLNGGIACWSCYEKHVEKREKGKRLIKHKGRAMILTAVAHSKMRKSFNNPL